MWLLFDDFIHRTSPSPPPPHHHYHHLSEVSTIHRASLFFWVEKERWLWRIHGEWVKPCQCPNSDHHHNPPFVVQISHTRSLSIIVSVLFWVGLVLFKQSLNFLLLLRVGIAGVPAFTAVALTPVVTVMGLLWNGTGIGGLAIFLRLNRLIALPPYSR